MRMLLSTIHLAHGKVYAVCVFIIGWLAWFWFLAHFC